MAFAVDFYKKSLFFLNNNKSGRLSRPVSAHQYISILAHQFIIFAPYTKHQYGSYPDY
jgi:hypothetical protein